MTDAELEKVHVEINKLMAETSRLNTERRQVSCEVFWYPVAISIGLITVVATITKLLIECF